MQSYYRGAIWTNHALLRIRQRGISQDVAADAFNNPDTHMPGSEKDTIRYQKRLGAQLITLVAKQNDKSEWIILSVWVDPPFPGSEDDKRRKAYREYQRKSFWGKFWITLKRQVGLSRY